jgi:hypothetical protein
MTTQTYRLFEDLRRKHPRWSTREIRSEIQTRSLALAKSLRK